MSESKRAKKSEHRPLKTMFFIERGQEDAAVRRAMEGKLVNAGFTIIESSPIRCIAGIAQGFRASGPKLRACMQELTTEFAPQRPEDPVRFSAEVWFRRFEEDGQPARSFPKTAHLAWPLTSKPLSDFTGEGTLHDRWRARTYQGTDTRPPRKSWPKPTTPRAKKAGAVNGAVATAPAPAGG